MLEIHLSGTSAHAPPQQRAASAAAPASSHSSSDSSERTSSSSAASGEGAAVEEEEPAFISGHRIQVNASAPTAQTLTQRPCPTLPALSQLLPLSVERVPRS